MTTFATLGYWDMRGLAEPIRYLLKYVGINFYDKRYPFGEGLTLKEVPNIVKFWKREEFSHGLDFPNLPFYIDEDVKVGHSFD